MSLIGAPRRALNQALLGAADRATGRARRRQATELFYFGRDRPVDRALTTLYFGLTARRWLANAEDPLHLAVFEYALAWLDREPARIIDVGTGAGATAARLATRWPHATVTGLDVSRRMLRFARRRHRAANLSFASGSIRRLPHPPGTVDLVVAYNAIVFPREMGRVAAPDALVLFANSYVPLPAGGDEEAEQAAWRDAGFERVRAEDVESGSAQLFARRRTP